MIRRHNTDAVLIVDLEYDVCGTNPDAPQTFGRRHGLRVVRPLTVLQPELRVADGLGT